MRKYVNIPLKPVPIVRDGAIGHPDWGEGRLIPVLVLDTTEHAHVESLIAMHAHASPGDVTVQWGSRPLSRRTVLLHVSFSRPTLCEFVLQFNIAMQGIVVDSILHSHGLMIVAGRAGDRVVTTLDAPRIIMEIPDTGFLTTWTPIFLTALRKRFDKNGLSKKQALAAAEAHISRSREMWRLRRSTGNSNDAQQSVQRDGPASGRSAR